MAATDYTKITHNKTVSECNASPSLTSVRPSLT